MSGTIQLRRGTTAERTAITPAAGEPVWDTTLKTLYIGDAAAAGGIGLLVPQGATRLDFSSCTPAVANTDGGIMKGGTSASKLTTATANMKFMAFYLENTATSGDNRGMYLRLYHSGAGGGGEALRVFSTVNDVAGGTVHGAHLSLNFATTGSVTGLGVAARCTLHIPDTAAWGPGTIAALQAEIWSEGANSDPAGATELSFIRVVNDGHANGIADVDDDAFLFAFSGGSIGAGNMMAAQSAAAVSHTLKVKGTDGATYYLMVSDTQ